MLLWDKVDKDEIKVESGTAEMTYIVKSLSELEEHTQYIVRGKFRGDSVEDLQRRPSGGIKYGCTITSFDVSPVIQGENLKAGDVIKIGEEYYVDSKGVLQTMFNYMPSETGKEYILFLSKETDPDYRFYVIYAPINFEVGRYPVEPPANIDTASNRTLDLGSKSSDVYKSIYKDVIAKYLS